MGESLPLREDAMSGACIDSSPESSSRGSIEIIRISISAADGIGNTCRLFLWLLLLLLLLAALLGRGERK